MSLQSLVQGAKGQATKSPTVTSSKGLGRLLASSVPTQAVSTTPPQAPKSLGDKIMGGLQGFTDFLGLRGTTDTLGADIAHTTLPEHSNLPGLPDQKLKSLLPAPTASQNLGAALQVGSFLLPATGAERIAGALAEGALTKAALSGAAAGAQYGALGGAGQALTATPNATDADILKQTLTQGGIGAAGGALLGLGGAAAGKGLAKLLGKSKPIELPTVPPDEPPPGSSAPTVLTPEQKQAAYAKAQGYEPITPTERLPVIQAGPKNKDTLPTIQSESPNIKTSDEPAPTVQQKLPPIKKGRLTPGEKKGAENPFPPNKLNPATKPLVNGKVEPPITYEPIKEPAERSVPSETPSTATIGSRTDKGAPVTVKVPKIANSGGSGLKNIKGGDVKTSKVSSDINTKLVSQGFDELSPEEKSSFNSITKAEQITKITKLIDSDAEKARLMALGKEKIPNDIHPQALFNSVKNKATREGDGETLRRLASSPVAKQRALIAQALGASGFENGEFDPVKAINEIQKSREQNQATRGATETKEKVVQKVKSEIRKTNTKETWSSFIKELEC